jgi:hypothetical protein
MLEIFLAPLIIVIGVVVISRRRRAGAGKPALPSRTMTGSASRDAGLVQRDRPSATTAMTAETDKSSVAAAMPHTHEAPGPLPDSGEPYREPSSAKAGVTTTSAADGVGLARPELEPESLSTSESSAGEQSSTEPQTNASSDDSGDKLNDGSRDYIGPSLIHSAGSIDIPPATTINSAPPIGERRPQRSISPHQIDAGSPGVSPEGLAALTANEVAPATALLLEKGTPGQSIELPSGADSDAVAAEERKGEPDVAQGVQGERDEPVPEIADVLDANEDGVETWGTPRRYRPAPRLLRPDRAGTTRNRDSAAGSNSLQMAVRLSFRTGGICQFSLLAQRRSDLPERIEVRGRDRTELLRALQDDWYELKAPNDLSGLLRDGAAWTSTQPGKVAARWTLASRDIYVLGVLADFGGYVSTPRLTIGEDHVVLCVAGRQTDVSAALRAAGCAEARLIESGSGVPHGWIAFRNVKPSRWVPAANDGDVLETLRPLANIDIRLEGGIKVDRSAWLIDHPPTIRLIGDLASAGEVMIDGEPVLVASDGVCVSPRLGELGEHTIWSSSATRRYQVVQGMQEWEPWAAHRTPNASICGATVFPLAGSQPDSRQVLVPAGEFALIGAIPGTVLHCSRDVSSRSPVSVAFPRFDPVWIIPRYPLRCDRRTACVRRIGTDLPSLMPNNTRPRIHRASLWEWSSLILDAHRRKLISDPADVTTANLWAEYERAARSIWRRLK